MCLEITGIVHSGLYKSMTVSTCIQEYANPSVFMCTGTNVQVTTVNRPESEENPEILRCHQNKTIILHITAHIAATLFINENIGQIGPDEQFSDMNPGILL